MVELDPGFAARLASETTTLAMCWRIVRTDGVALGFTAHDRDLVVDGLRYRSRPGMLPSAITLSDGFDADLMEVSGALSAAAIAGRDLEAGRYDGASLELFLVDWEAPSAGRLPMARGTLGNFTQADQSFTAELRGPAAQLERPVTELISPECRASLGDRRCRVPLAARTSVTVVTAVVDAVTVDVSAAAGDYAYGRLRWLEGANAGLDSAILGSIGNRLTLREPPPFALASGVRVELREGCDKRLATCATRFANAANFRGEPHVPGSDLLTRYPGV